jgi:hypothetical protein
MQRGVPRCTFRRRSSSSSVMTGTSMRNILRQSILVALLVAVVTRAAPAQVRASSLGTPRPAPSADTASGGRSSIIPAVEITSFLVLLNVYDRFAYPNETQDGKKVYYSTFSSTWDHIRTQQWVHDQDPFNVNQFSHPYQGAMMYGFARTSGHGFWTSLLQSNLGSFAWKMAGETDPPSVDDMITTGQAGSLLGEALYRISDLILKDFGGDDRPRWQNYLATIISPPAGLNRRVFGGRFKTELPDSAPATSWQLRLGATVDALVRDRSTPVTLLQRDATAEFSMSYGLPGQHGYEYTRPLDYFDFQLSFLSTAKNPIENVMIRGLLKGGKTGESADGRGIWGLYGSYDYISPFLFRVSSTAVSVGTTRQYWITPGLALQGSTLGGVGYGAAGSTTVVPSTPTNAAIRDYHFGVTPQALVALRLIAGDRAMFDMTTREYYVSGLGSDDTHGSETIFRGDFGITLRVVGGHALGTRIVASTRNAQYGKLPSKNLSEGTVTVAYTFLGRNRFSAVKWKE